MPSARPPVQPPRARLAVALIALGLLAGVPGEGGDPSLALVRVLVQRSEPDPLAPWQHADVYGASGSGVILSGRRILTNAHVVDDAAYIEVQREGLTRRLPARVAFVNESCDLALLECDDPEFFEGVQPAELGGLPAPQDEVRVLGYPMGGETLAVTKGIVSRIEVSDYAHSGDRRLMVQIDAPVNPGNSGGPALVDGMVVGLATQHMKDAQNISYIVPAPVIEQFLDDVEDGRVGGAPDLDIEVQPLENEALRRSLQLQDSDRGVRICESGLDELVAGDVLLAVDGVDVAPDGTVPLDGLRVEYSHLVHQHQVGDEIEVQILRRGKFKYVELELSSWDYCIVPQGRAAASDYFVYGGLVFQRLSSDFLEAIAESESGEWLGMALIDASNVLDWRSSRAEFVVISKVLGHAVNRGYDEVEFQLVDVVDGRKVDRLEDVIEHTEQAEGPQLEILTEDGTLLVFDRDEVREATVDILRGYGLAWDRSPSLRSARVLLADQDEHR